MSRYVFSVLAATALLAPAQVFAEVSEAEIQELRQQLAALAQRLLGFAHIAIALAALLVLHRHYRGDQRWALLFLLIIMLPVWPPGLFLIPPAIPIAFGATVALSVLWILGLLIGALATRTAGQQD